MTCDYIVHIAGNERCGQPVSKFFMKPSSLGRSCVAICRCPKHLFASDTQHGLRIQEITESDFIVLSVMWS